MARLLWISLALLCCTSILQGQVVLRNSLSGNTKTLKQGGYATLSIPVSGPDISCGYRKLQGKLLDGGKGLLRLEPQEEIRTVTFSSGLQKEDKSSYEGISNLPAMSVAKVDIDYISYRSKNAEAYHNSGLVITTLGALTALVVAPLVSLNYSEGAFNSDRYFRWAGISLGATGVGVAMTLGTKKRGFQLQRPGMEAGRKVWVFQGE